MSVNFYVGAALFSIYNIYCFSLAERENVKLMLMTKVLQKKSINKIKRLILGVSVRPAAFVVLG